MKMLRLFFCLTLLLVALPLRAQYTFGSVTTSGTGSPTISQVPGSSGYEYTNVSGTGSNFAYVPLTGSSASVITTASGWTATLLVSISARSITNNGSQDGDVGMGLGIFSGSLSDHVVVELEQVNNSDGGDTSDFADGFYGTSAKFAAETNGTYVPTTQIGQSVAGNEGDSYLQLTGGTLAADTPSTESLAGAYGYVALSYNSATQVITGYYNGTPFGSYSLASWGTNPPLTLVITGASGTGAVVTVGTDIGSSFSANQGQPFDVSHYGINKKITFDQTSPAEPTLDPSSPYQFTCDIEPGNSGALFANATLTPPANGTGTVAFTNGPYGLNFQGNFTTLAALDAAFPNGTYNLMLQTTTPNNYTDQLTFAAVDAYPAIPQITSLTNASWVAGALVVADITKPVTINWVNPSNLIYTNFNLSSNSGSNLSNNSSGSGLNTFTIPANTLSNNLYYEGSIQSNYGIGSFNASTIPSSNEGIDFQTEVDFTLQTGSGATSSSSTYNSLFKSHVLVQTSPSAPVDGIGIPNNGDPAPYNLSVQCTTPGTVTGPNGTTLPLAYSVYEGNNDQGGYEYSSGTVTSAGSLNAAYPDGTYTFPTSPAQSVTVGGSYLAAAAVATVNNNPPVWNAQGQLVLDPSIQNIIAWSPVTVANFATNGYEQAQISADNNGNFQSIKAQAGVTTSNPAFTTLTIPANALTPGVTYHGRIQYFKTPTGVVNPSTNVYFVGGYRTLTEFAVVATYPTGLLQAITFPPIARQVYTGSPFALNPLPNAAASSGLPVIYGYVSGPATLSNTNNGTVSVTGIGTVILQASQAGNATYAAAASSRQSFSVANAVPYTGSVTTPAGADGISPFLKYFFDINPNETMTAADRAALPAVGYISSPTTNGMTANYLALTYRKFALETGCTATPQISPDLQNWTNVTNGSNGTLSQVSVDPVTGDPIFQAKVQSYGTNQFIRLHVTKSGGGGGGGGG